MAKAKTTIRPKKDESSLSRFSIDKILPQKYHIPAVMLVVLVLFLVFFAPMYFGGKTFQSGDIVSSKSMYNYLHSDDGGYTLWNPYIFCGMPAYAIATAFKWFNLIEVGMYSAVQIFSAFFAVEYAQWTLRLIILAITTFFFTRYFTKNVLINLFAAVAAAFSTGIIVFLFIGHVTKLASLCMYPLIFLMLLRFQERIKLLDVAVLIIALQLFVQGWHVQIIFYTLFAAGIYFLYYLLRSLKLKDYVLTKQLLKSAAVFVFAAAIALLIQLDNFTQIYEYSPYSTRGTVGIQEKHAEVDESSGSEFYEYATNWSFSPGEVLTFIVPSFYGFGGSTYQGPLTNNQPYEVNTYFGQMMFVDVPMYMGVVVLLLALFGIVLNWKMPYVRYLTILVVISLFISFGRTFPVIFDLMFNYFPFFNKFRVPSMMLVLVQMNIPILAAIGLHKIIQLRAEGNTGYLNIIRNLAFVFAGILVLVVLAQGGIAAWFVSRVNEAGQQAQQLKPLFEYMSDMFVSDTIIAFFLLTLVTWLVYLYSKNKLGADALVLLIVAVTIFDLFRIDGRGAKYIEDQNINQVFAQPDYITAIKSQNDKDPFRLLNLKQDNSIGSLGQNSNFHAYFLVQDVYGYSGIKPRGYQDILDVVGTPANPTLMRMLNVKYLVTGQPLNFPGFTPVMNAEKSNVYRNDSALERAYFVDSVAVQKPLEILNAIKNNTFDPGHVAFVEEGGVNADKPDSTASVSIIRYSDEVITLKAKASGNNFLFLGDTYIPVGWKAYIDGKETKIYKANHNFRGIIVPKGEHNIKFEYAPVSFTISKYVSLGLSSLTLVFLIIGIYQNKKQKPAAKE
jgi:hypothetical protein